jgi:nitric oxide reductase NorQ protein
MRGEIVKYQDFAVIDEPYYEAINNEVLDFEVAFHIKRPLSLIGPTGCGKTTLATYMAFKLRQDLIAVASGETSKLEISKSEIQNDGSIAFPYIEIPCHEDMTETHLVGRYGLGNEWLPGPLYIGATVGGIVVLDEIVEARKDSVVLTHSLTDDRRVLPVPKKGEVILPPDDFMLVICYNPGYQVKSKNLKPSTRQRYPTVEMDYAPPEKEHRIIVEKTGVDAEVANKLVGLAAKIRGAKSSDAINLQEGASTRLLVMAAEYYQQYLKMGKEPDLAHIARVTIFNPISSEDTDRDALEEMLRAF